MAVQKNSINSVSARLYSQPDRDALLKLLDEWLADESGYDEQVWPKIEKGLRENPLSLFVEAKTWEEVR